MHQGVIVWAAAACPIRGAGVYVGLSRSAEQYVVARRLLPKRARPYTGGAVRLQPDRERPLVYLAVRDPSAVRVVPLNSRPTRDGRRYVVLRFPPDLRRIALGHPAPVPALEEVADMARKASRCGFIVTVGLRPALEEEFHRSVVLRHDRQTWFAMDQAVREFGRSE